MVSSESTSFRSFASFVTRQSGRGYTLGAQEALDRKTVLRMWTQHGAKYVYREDVLGSIEVGKWGDLVVLDKNPLDEVAVSDEELANIQVLMTIVGGEAVYDRDRDGAPPEELRR